MDSVFTCTACAVTFSDSEAHKTHYKLDWHRYNLRRKVADLGPIDQGDFNRRLAAALGPNAPKAAYQGRCKECRKSFRSEGLYKQHLQSKKHKEAAKAIAAATAAPPDASSLSASGSSTVSATSGGSGGGQIAAAAEAASVGDGVGEEGAGVSSAQASADVPSEHDRVEDEEMREAQLDGEEDEEEDEGGEELPPPRMGPGVCVFCNVESASFEKNCAHMLQEHGFFIPDVEFLTDPEGLVGYVEEKVKLGNICLYCNGKGKTFHTYRSLQQHMTDRSHCKLLYDEDEDLHEYESFYDFSKSYSAAEEKGLVESSADASGETDGTEEDAAEVDVSRTLGVTDLGELVLLDGKTVGNRKWSRYYKQRLRTADEREVTVAHRTATRLRLGAMYDEEMRKGTSTGGAVALRRGESKAFGGLPGVMNPKDVKMLRAHQRIQARERLKTGIRQNKLNKTFDRVAEM